MSLAKEYADTKPIGVFTMGNFGGLMVLDIKYGIEDTVVTCFDFGSGRRNFSESKIRYTNPKSEYEEPRAFFVKLDQRYYFDQIERV